MFPSSVIVPEWNNLPKWFLIPLSHVRIFMLRRRAEKALYGTIASNYWMFEWLIHNKHNDQATHLLKRVCKPSIWDHVFYQHIKHFPLWGNQTSDPFPLALNCKMTMLLNGSHKQNAVNFVCLWHKTHKHNISFFKVNMQGRIIPLWETLFTNATLLNWFFVL